MERDQINIAITLRRIRQILANSLRLHASGQLNSGHLNAAKDNLFRIEAFISANTFESLRNGIDSLLLLHNSEHNSNRQNQPYCAPRMHIPGKGRPKVDVSESQLRLLFNEGFTVKKMSTLLGCSQSTVNKNLRQLNMPVRSRYSVISREDLETKVREIHQEHPNAGYVMMSSYLKTRGTVVPRHRIRIALNAIDPVGTASRWSRSIKRRIYKVSTPNALWHMDAHLKLSRWGFVIHGCVDGYSRLIVYLKCETSIKAEPVLKLFTEAVENYGLPSRVRSDHGYENILVALLMNTLRGLQRGSHITGQSVHNQRIERLWLDVYKEVCDSVHTELYTMEGQGILDPDNLIHKFCVQYLYKDYINEKLISFQSAWNSHKIRTENSKTPRQLWLGGILSNYSSTSTSVREILDSDETLHQRLVNSLTSFGLDLSGDITNITYEHAEAPNSSFTVELELNQEQTAFLSDIKNSRRATLKEKFVQCVNFLNS